MFEGVSLASGLKGFPLTSRYTKVIAFLTFYIHFTKVQTKKKFATFL
ncbi:hypothetical protein BC670_0318 [Flavobacterium branchiophilum]|uniref:Uncharacterized protein n=1 Tax=Flavobacterium branchiophilum TaxID=55197 RepID=A0A543G0B5_9FLAO|nr:hypothetical protein BC670_0318 [Flavobacterium branchiophilum]